MIKQKLFFIAGPLVLLASTAPFMPRDQRDNPTECLPSLVGEWLANSDGRSEKYALQRAGRGEFLEELDAIVAELDCETLSLREAADHVIAYASENYPFYLSILHYVEEGRTLRERVAINLVRQYAYASFDSDERLEALLEGWDAELQAIREEP